MKPVKESKIQDATSCTQEQSVVEVAKLIKVDHARHVIVLDEKQFPTGIISTVDICNKVVAEGKDANTLTAKDIMTSPILVKNMEDDLGEVYRTMMEQNIYSVPIVQEGKLVGILSFNTVLKELTKGAEE